MRPFLAALLFAFAVALAACSGGGGSSSALVPYGSGGSNSPQYTGASLSLKIPAQSRSGSGKRPAYVSPNTESVQIFAYPFASPQVSASPQTFTVATPSPCTEAADGSKTCTFNVQAPLGEDQFIIKTYGVPNPGPSDTPLATFQTGAINVALGSATPTISVALTGVVTRVDVGLQNADPADASSTEFWPVRTPMTVSTLSITPRDASGAAILTDTFSSPITVTINPATLGVSLALSASQCSPASTLTRATVTITCAKDLGSVTYSYNGTITRDTSGKILDRITFAGQPQPNQSAAPALLALTGTTILQSLPAPVFPNSYPIEFLPQSNGTFVYLLGGSTQSVLGSFDPANPSTATAVSLPYGASGITQTNNGEIWVADHSGGSDTNLYCYSSVTGNQNGPFSLPLLVSPFTLTTDGNGNVWYFGQDTTQYLNWAGYIPITSPCAFPSAPPAPIQIGTTDYPQSVVAAPNVGALSGVYLLTNANSSSGLIYYANTSSSLPITLPVASAGASIYGNSLTSGVSGNAYASLDSLTTSPSTITQLVAPPTSPTANNASLPSGAAPVAAAIFPQTTNPSTIAYADSALGIGTLDVTSSFSSSKVQVVPVAMGSGYSGYATFFDKHGDAWMAYPDSLNTPTLVHLIRTSVWTIANTSLSTTTGGGTVNIAISETGDSGPFTISKISDPTAATAGTAYGGTLDHLIPLQISAGAQGTVPLTITVTDANGLSQTKTFSLTRSLPGARRHNLMKTASRSHYGT